MGLLTAFREDFYPASVDDLPPIPEFSIQAATSAAWASQLAYEVDNEEKFRRIAGNWGWIKVSIVRGQFASYLPLPSTKGFVASTSAGTTVIAVAGTEPTSLLNWFSDLAIHKTPDGVHSGFDCGARAILEAVEAIIDPAQGINRIYLAGHSLGAAIVVMVAYRLLERGLLLDRLMGVYTIGMPRLGSESFKNEYKAAFRGKLWERTYRLVQGFDVVPNVPPAESPFDFRHVGNVLTCSHGGRFPRGRTPEPAVDNPVPGADSLRHLAEALTAGPEQPDLTMEAYPGERLVARLLIDHSSPSIRDHLPDRYLQVLS